MTVPPEPNKSLVFTVRTYARIMGASFVAFFVFLFGIGAAIIFGFGWELALVSAVFSAGSLVGAKAAQEFMTELRHLASMPVVDPAEDLFSKG